MCGQWIDQVVVNSKLKCMYIEDGKIRRLLPMGSIPANCTNVWDAQGLLMLPTFTDSHVHLDKGFPQDQWISRRKVGSILEQFALEKELLAPFSKTLREQARQTLNELLSYGTTHLRVHVDIDPDIGVSHVETILSLKEEFKHCMTMELVAFPQQGLVRSSSASYVSKALDLGISIVGGVDPAGVDRDIEASLKQIFDIAVSHDAEIDIHLHDPGHLGLFTIERILDYTEQTDAQGKVTISHAYCLGELQMEEVSKLGRRLVQLDVQLITSVPMDSAMPPVSLLKELGVKVRLGTDHTGLDAWTPFGDADLLNRGRRLAEMNKWHDDESLRSTYTFFTSAPLTFHEGDEANFILLKALSPEHALSIVPSRELVCVKGIPVAGKQLSTAWSSLPVRSGRE